MSNTKSISEEILEEYANYYSQVDLERLTAKLDQLRAEAIKEFAERVKDLIYEADDINPVSETQIDNLVKEMVGE